MFTKLFSQKLVRQENQQAMSELTDTELEGVVGGLTDAQTGPDGEAPAGTGMQGTYSVSYVVHGTTANRFR